MSISKEEVKHIAELARISLSEKEAEKFQKELSSILGYVAKMNEVDTRGVEPASYSLKEVFQKRGKVSQVRKDKAGEEEKEIIEAMLGQMPDRKNRFLKVKRVFENR